MSKLKDIDLLLKGIIIILGFIIVTLLFVLPKDHCDTCNFDGLKGKMWFKVYSANCLQHYSYGEENPNYPPINLTNINLTNITIRRY